MGPADSHTVTDEKQQDTAGHSRTQQDSFVDLGLTPLPRPQTLEGGAVSTKNSSGVFFLAA